MRMHWSQRFLCFLVRRKISLTCPLGSRGHSCSPESFGEFVDEVGAAFALPSLRTAHLQPWRSACSRLGQAHARKSLIRCGYCCLPSCSQPFGWGGVGLAISVSVPHRTHAHAVHSPLRFRLMKQVFEAETPKLLPEHAAADTSRPVSLYASLTMRCRHTSVASAFSLGIYIYIREDASSCF